MQNPILKFIMIIVFFSNLYVLADNRIVINLRTAPMRVQREAELEVKRMMKLNRISQKTPGKISKKMLKNEFKKYKVPKLGGFLALYSGYADYSNPNGLISFPLRHEDKKLYLVITPNIKLIDVRGNTISHKEFLTKEKKNTIVYLFEKKQDKNKQFFWRVRKQKIPKHNRISALSVVLLTKPKNIYVETGDFISSDNNQMVLPINIYVLGKSSVNNEVLNFLDTQRYYEPIKIKKEKIDDLVSKKMILNN